MFKNIYFGIKVSIKNFDLLQDIYQNKRIIDFIEIILNPEFSLSDIKIIEEFEIPYAIHIPNSNYGIDFGDINKNMFNINYIKKLNQFANILDPFCYIVHPESGDINFSIKNIKKLKVKPIALENMPLKSLRGGELLGYDIESLRSYFKQIQDLELCFDINHAIKTSISKNINYITFIKMFLKFKEPVIFHISGGNLNKEFDEHLSLNEGDYNLSQIKKILINLNKKINLTFETQRILDNRIEDDLRNMEFFIKS